PRRRGTVPGGRMPTRRTGRPTRWRVRAVRHGDGAPGPGRRRAPQGPEATGVASSAHHLLRSDRARARARAWSSHRLPERTGRVAGTVPAGDDWAPQGTGGAPGGTSTPGTVRG